MITKTSTVVYARAAERGRGNREHWAHDLSDGTKGEPFGPEVSYYGKVEIVRTTTVEKQRNNGTLMPGTAPERTEEVLLTLDTAEAAHLVGSLATALANALDVQSGSKGYQHIKVTEVQS